MSSPAYDEAQRRLAERRAQEAVEAAKEADHRGAPEAHRRARIKEVTMTSGYDDEIIVAEAAKILGVTKQAVHKMIRRGALDSRRVGPIHLVPADQVEMLREMRRGVEVIRHDP